MATPRDDHDVTGSEECPGTQTNIPVLPKLGHTSKPILVAAIDFGTTYSGYAFSFLHDYQNDPLKISTPQNWNAGSGGLLSLKTPTVLFYDPGPRKEEVLFGYEAENRYTEVIRDKDKTVFKRCFYFSLFKMELYGHKTISQNLQIPDIAGRKMKAVEVFSMSLKWLKEHLFKLLKTQGREVQHSEVQWVITVPAIWNDAAKHFMRIAGKQAGISEGRLLIALEPEAASVYCQHVPVDKHVFPDGTIFSELDINSKFMVADLGGGTADITVHQKLPNHTLRELLSASGGNHGGSAINKTYLQFWANLVGDTTMKELKQNYMEDHVDLLRDFENAKRNAGVKGRAKVVLKIPARLNQLCRKNNNQKSIQELAIAKHEDNVEVISDKLRLKTDFFNRTFFDPTIKGILKLLNTNLNCGEASGVSIIILVGGFAECNLVNTSIHAAMAAKNVKVIVPEESGLAVLKGAVIFGHRPRIIQSRITKYTYGISSAPKFDQSRHNPEKLIEMDGKFYCKDVFSTFMLKGTSLDQDHRIRKRAATVVAYQSNMKFEIYGSTSRNPTYTTDPGCIHIGDLIVDINNLTKEPQQIEVEYMFGETLLNVTSYVEGGSPCTVSLGLPDS